MQTTIRVILAVVTLAMTVPPATALTESLSQPRIFFRKDADKAHMDAMHAVAQDKKFAFRSGAISYWEPHFHTTLVYDGDTLSLDQFLTSLSKVPGARVKITLSPDLAKELRSMPGGAWSLTYSHQTPDQPEVRINLADGRIQFGKLLEKWLASEGRGRSRGRCPLLGCYTGIERLARLVDAIPSCVTGGPVP